MQKTTEQFMAFGRFTLKWYLIISALMFAGGVLAGAGLALLGYTLPQPF